MITHADLLAQLAQTRKTIAAKALADALRRRP